MRGVDVERAAHRPRSTKNTGWPPHTYTTRNENIPASFGLLSAIKRIPPVQPRTKRATRPKQGPNLSCAHRRAPHRAAPLLKISLAIFHCDHRNWDLGFSAIRSAVAVDSALGYMHSIDRALRSCRHVGS